MEGSKLRQSGRPRNYRALPIFKLKRFWKAKRSGCSR